MDDKKELIVRLTNGRTIRSGSELRGAGAYVRVCRDDGSELAYWDKQEWQDDPELVMGAILFAAEGITREEAVTGDVPANEQLLLMLTPVETKSLLRLLDAAMTCFAGSAGGVLHPLRDRILVANEAHQASKQPLTGEPGVAKVIRWFESLSYPTQDKRVEQLDETIHELFATQASAVNNAGIAEQVKFVFEECGDKAWNVLGETWDEWEFKA